MSSVKFLLDECLPFHLQDRLSGEFIQSTQILPRGTSDDIIFQEAKKRNLILVTADLKFVVRTLKKNEKVIYQNQEGDRYRIHLEHIASDCWKREPDKLTKYLLKNETIIIP